MTLSDKITHWVVNDYFTPNVKAEVVLDTLLTPYILQIIQNQMGRKVEELSLVAKEMSLFEPGSDSNRGAKIDYVLADSDRVYLVELKTTCSSFNDDQVSRYALLAEKEPCFGNVLGKRLLNILEDVFPVTWDSADGMGDESLTKAWEKIWSKKANYIPKDKIPQESDSYTQMAMDLIKEKGWAWRGDLRSRKYVYTLGQIMDYLKGGNRLWNKPIRLIYLTPGELYPHKILEEERYQDFYLGTVSLIKARAYLAKQEDELAQLLANILKDIYGG